MLTQHAQIRAQQRGIPPLVVQWLLEFGSEAKAPGGVTRRYFDKEARRRLASAVGSAVVDRMGDLMNLYLVESADKVITTGVRTRRIKRS